MQNIFKHSLAVISILMTTIVIYKQANATTVYNHGDNFWYIPTAQSLIHHRSLNLAFDYSEEIEKERQNDNWMVMRSANGDADGWYNYFPPGPAVLSIPVVMIFDLFRPGLPSPPSLERDFEMAARSARFIAIASAVLFYAVVFVLSGRLLLSLFLSFLFAFATPQLSVHAGGLWSHNASLFFLLCMFLSMLRFRKWSGWFLMFAVFSRPTAVLFVLLVFLFLYLKKDRLALLSFAASLVVGLLLYFYLPLSDYFSGATFTFNQSRYGFSFFEALAGTLVSPNRGLFVFLPFALFSVWGAVLIVRQIVKDQFDLHAKAKEYRSEENNQQLFYLVLVSGVCLNWLVVSLNPNWWFGYSFGPRSFAEHSASLVLLLLPTTDWFRSLQNKRLKLTFIFFFFITIAVSVFIHVCGATEIATARWNEEPVSVDKVPARSWDVHDLQFLRRD